MRTITLDRKSEYAPFFGELVANGTANLESANGSINAQLKKIRRNGLQLDVFAVDKSGEVVWHSRSRQKFHRDGFSANDLDLELSIAEAMLLPNS